MSKSIKAAESGFAFAKRAQDLCNALGEEECSDELIHGFITEMQVIAQKAYADAKATKEMLDVNKLKFTEVRRDHTDKSRGNTISIDPNPHFRDFQRYQDQTSGSHCN